VNWFRMIWPCTTTKRSTAGTCTSEMHQKSGERLQKHLCSHFTEAPGQPISQAVVKQLPGWDSESWQERRAETATVERVRAAFPAHLLGDEGGGVLGLLREALDDIVEGQARCPRLRGQKKNVEHLCNPAQKWIAKAPAKKVHADSRSCSGDDRRN